MRTKVIAEAGVNHNGSLDLAIALVEAAYSCGADAVKFQTFSADALSAPWAPLAEYQANSNAKAETQHDMLRQLELSRDDQHRLKTHASKVGIEFLSTPYDRDSLYFLVEELHLSTIKIGSGDLSNLPLLVEVGRLKRDLILSTGMSTLQDVSDGLRAYAFGLTTTPGTDFTGHTVPSSFADLFRTEDRRVTLLHAVSEYPAPEGSLNLRAIQTLRETFGLPTGFSDHSIGPSAAALAVALGASVIEKHLTLDRNMVGPDHSASADPGQFRELVDAVRQSELLLGDGVKIPTEAEERNRSVVSKSLCAAVDMPAGAILTHDNISFMRPGGGLPPGHFWRLLGTRTTRDYRKGEQIE